jgi:hypothetical protein
MDEYTAKDRTWRAQEMPTELPDQPLDGPEIAFYSFWRPESVHKHTKDLRFQSLGHIGEITEKLLRLPHIKPMFCPIIPSVRALWKVERGVVLQTRAEQGTELQGQVLMIGATSAVPDRILFRLYVQLYEQFGVTLLDETTGNFLTVRQFKDRWTRKQESSEPSDLDETE